MTDVRPRVSAVLRRFLADRGAMLAAIDPGLAPFVEMAEQVLLGGGKLLRPAFCYWGWRGAGGSDGAEIVTAAASLEVLHACALVHDDLMDGSPLRRGRPSAHRSLAAAHRARGLPGDSDRFGQSAAVLLGDLFLSWADDLLMASGLEPAALLRAWPTYARMRTELVAGQYLDLTGHPLDLDTDETFGAAGRPLRPDDRRPGGEGGTPSVRIGRIARYKTAGYTVIRPLQLGALLAGGSPDLVAVYAAFGGPLGEAFQLRDDILDLFGDPMVTGKPAGEDLRNGRPNALLALAARQSDAAGLRALFDRPDLPAALEQARTFVADSGALDLAEQRIASCTATAIAALTAAGEVGTVGMAGTAGAAGLDATTVEALTHLATAATARAQ
ncbi:polyprenyl synthetase family protein [Frankia sp. R82]|uniref:polyprenyl synthetase family protein n=1 Tax=Frankia sp. R82 TaxID=2950553 RepID=UPI00204385A3|nr:polyprenyl synthetase family protein [Frankia sp. R82]MCM3886411.1 polyprenyl synthetase family protein [Frankia sp. R82]